MSITTAVLTGNKPHIDNHRGQVEHIYISKLRHHPFRLWLVVCAAPKQYHIQRHLIVNLPMSTKLPWNWGHQNTKLLIQEHVVENDVCKLVSILFKSEWVEWYRMIRLLMDIFLTPLSYWKARWTPNLLKWILLANLLIQTQFYLHPSIIITRVTKASLFIGIPFKFMHANNPFH